MNVKDGCNTITLTTPLLLVWVPQSVLLGTFARYEWDLARELASFANNLSTETAGTLHHAEQAALQLGCIMHCDEG